MFHLGEWRSFEAKDHLFINLWAVLIIHCGQFLAFLRGGDKEELYCVGLTARPELR